MLHVLAHVRATAHLPASVYDAAYVAAVAAHLGPASARALGEDAALLGRLVPTHEGLARVQTVAWLFRSPARALAAATSDLADLDPAAVDRPALLSALVGDPAAEILRAAALLELPGLAGLPPWAPDLPALGRALSEVAAAAPRLRRADVRVSRALGFRGRVVGDEIWVGGGSVEHAAWQAAHEATVAEISEAAAEALPYEPLERAAVAALGRRAVVAGLSDRHRAWLSFYGDDWLRSGT